VNSSAFVTRSLEEMERVFEPKLAGLEALHDLFQNQDLDFFVTFTSISGLIPRLARGLSDYAMANAFADHFAAFQFHQHRRAHYRTISWVDWNDTGYATRMAPEDKARLERGLAEVGLAPFSTSEGCRLFDLAMEAPDRNWVLPCHLEPQQFAAAQRDLLKLNPRPLDSAPSPHSPFPTPHSALRTPHSGHSPFPTPHSALHTPHSGHSPFPTPHSALRTPHSSHSPFPTPHSALRTQAIPHSPLRTPHSTLRTQAIPHSPLRTPHSALRTQEGTLCSWAD
jgi:hypothetical protein